MIVNCGAYTAVDKAETEQALAFAINGEAPGVLATWAHRHGIPFIQVSTDYVFDGESKAPYTEDQEPKPINVYGASKLEGEQRVLAAHPHAVILRVAWLYHHEGANFFRTMLRLAETRDRLTVVADQHGAPTSCNALALIMTDIVRQLLDGADIGGIYHVPPEGQTVWAEFARAIFYKREQSGLGLPVTVEDIPASEYPTPAARPAYSVLSGEKLQRTLGLQLPHWRAQLDNVWEAYLSI